MASIYGAVSATGWRLRLDYTVSQDPAENRSTLALALYIYDGTGESYNQAANSCRYICRGKPCISRIGMRARDGISWAAAR